MITDILLVILIFFLYPIARPQRKPADVSNRINKVISMWFGWTRPGLYRKVPLDNFKTGIIRRNFCKLLCKCEFDAQFYTRDTWWGKLLFKWDVMHNEQMFAEHFKYLRQDTLDYMRDDL